MKKTLLKILGTIFAIVSFFIAQYHIRQYYGIEPRIWFFVVFGISVVGFIAILFVFYSEIKNMYKSFFHDDFIARTTLYIIYLVMIAWTALSILITATVVERKKRTGELVFGGMWVFIFLANLLDFLYS